jgi:Mg2+ and Co2+ transporter CorA
MSLATIDPAVMPILEEALGLAEAAIMAQQEEQQKIAAKERDIVSLRQQIADQERVILEKVANQQIINPLELERLLDQFEDLHILSPKERVKLAAHVQRNPSLIIPVFQKAADMLSKAPSEGAGIAKEESGIAKEDEDVDGWGMVGRELRR